MIRINYQFRTVGPLHTGSDVKSGTLLTLRRQKCMLPEGAAYETRLTDEQRRDAVVHILLGVWYAIDWDSIKGKRLMGIWDEFSHKLQAAGRARNRHQFLQKLCQTWGISSLRNRNVITALDALTDFDLLDTVRDESQYLVLKLRAVKDAAKEQQDETGLLTFDLPPIVPGEPRIVRRDDDMIPCISGNSFRGYLRDLVMYDFLERAGIGRIDKRAYHCLFSGGTIDQSNAYEDIGRQEAFVAHCPMLGVLGAAIGDGTIEGEFKSGFAYPLCRERGTAENSYWEYLDTVFQTRMDTSKRERKVDFFDVDDLNGKDKKESTVQMKYEFEVFADGTPFEHRIACTSANPLILSAFWHMLELFRAAPYIGGKGAAGAGEIDLSGLEIGGSGEEYRAYVRDNAKKIREFWANAKI